MWRIATRDTVLGGYAIPKGADILLRFDAGNRDPFKFSDPDRFDRVCFLGHGWTVGLAHEAALKMREAALAWSESYPAREYRHGPIAIASPNTVVWSLDPLDPALAQEVQATGATLVCEPLDSLAALVLAQRTAVALAQARGLDPDRPRNLARSVVLEGAALEVLS